MGKFAIAVVNGTQARFFTLDSAEFPVLKEYEGLFSAAKDRGQELWANTKTGRNRGTVGQAHAYDDHRQNHVIKFERQFAQQITDKIVNLLESNQARHLILVAEPQFLGLMRDTLKSPVFKTIKVKELGKDICHFSPTQIHDYLANKGLLPERGRMVE